MKNGVQLITYADRFGRGDLSTIQQLLTNQLDGVFAGVHILPFYRPYDRADAGFDPIEHTAVDPRLGNWESIRHIADTHDVVADLIVNHISDESPQFSDFLERGDESEYSNMFLEYGDVFPEGATAEELLSIYRPRPGLPFTTVTMGDRTKRLMWTTFTSHQIDLNLADPQARGYLYAVLERLARAGVALIRLDAIGYAIKTPGASCFMTSDTYRFIDELSEGVHARGMQSLLEIHSHYSDQIRAGQAVERVYDFGLPPLILYGLYTGSALPLRRWLEVSPRNAITVLDTHDGIGVIDVGPARDKPGLLEPSQIDDLVEGIHHATGGESRMATGASASNLDLYQVNSTFYSAVGCDDDRYLLARLIQFLCPGIPQVYYAGLLAARNDVELLRRTGVGRDINRPYFDITQIESALTEPVVQRLVDLIAFRNRHPAFDGEFTLGEGPPSELHLGWSAGEAFIEAIIDLDRGRFEIHHDGGEGLDTIEGWGDFAEHLP